MASRPTQIGSCVRRRRYDHTVAGIICPSMLTPELAFAVGRVRALASQDSRKGGKPKVRARRRRPTGPREPRRRESAKEPQRRHEESGGGRPSGRPPGSGGPGKPSTRPPRPGVGVGFPTGGLPIPGGLSPMVY